MIDDYKYSIGRTVVYKHANPGRSDVDYGHYGHVRTVGVVRAVEAVQAPDHTWLYIVENLRTGEITKVLESEIRFATRGKRERSGGDTGVDAAKLAETIAQSDPEESALPVYLRMIINDFVRREESESLARREGRQLPVEAGDYIRVRGDLRSELEHYHNHYAKVLEVSEPEIAAIEAKIGVHGVRRSYRVLLDDGSEHVIYDPEIKLYYTADGRKTILNWKAATFLAESFRDDPPYSVEYSYLEDHVFSRKELESMSHDDLADLFAAMLYVKGRIGLRDLKIKDQTIGQLPKDHLVDNILAISRFDMRRNRSLTPSEIERKKKDAFKLRRLLRGR